MEHGERKSGQEIAMAAASRKQGLLNKFLTKTYHMIDTCDPAIATWADNGHSFIIQDVKEFSKAILPQFFKHSKFSSFVRQLNFYAFRKLRPAPDVRPGANRTVRFAHDFFRKGRPELLHRIQRVTKSQEVCSNEVKSLKDELNEVSDEIDMLKHRMENRFRSVMSSVDLNYQQHMANVALSYQVLSQLVVELGHPKAASSAVKVQKVESMPPLPEDASQSSSSSSQYSTTLSSLPPPSAPSPPPGAVWKGTDIHEKSISPTCVADIQIPTLTSKQQASSAGNKGISPLMALSMIASMDHQQEFGS